jgi:putative sterol carrier protein
MADEASAARRSTLAAQLQGRPGAEIVAGIEAQGVDTVLDEVFAGMAAAFVPARAAGQSAIVQYDVVVPGGVRIYQLRVADGRCVVGKGRTEQARLTLGLGLADLMRLVAGVLQGPEAFMTGKLRLAGDVMFAQMVQGWFTPA